MILLKRLHNKADVLAKMANGDACAVTYSNRTQAQRKALELGEGWHVCRWSGPFYVVRTGRGKA